MHKIILRELPDIASIEPRYQSYDRLMKDERETLEADTAEASSKLFGITFEDTWHSRLPIGYAPPTYEEWEAHFDFLSWVYDEEPQFWEAFDIDASGPNGEELACLPEIGRQLVCALKRLHPAARLSFRPDEPRTDEQLEAEAEAWGRLLLSKHSNRP